LPEQGAEKGGSMEKIKALFVGAFTVISAWMGILAIPVYVLIALNIVDWITGYTAAPYRGRQRRSDLGFRGIVKKISMLLLVGVGWAMDWLLCYAAGAVGIGLPFRCMVASLVAVWLIANEMISILENIADIGVDMPPFLMQLARWVKKGVEAKAGDHPDAPKD
jgi:toxin secretion/phage lysis holin